MLADSSIPVVILAGGAGVRIGGNKESRMLGGTTLLARSFEKAKIYSHQIAVSTSTTSHLDLPNGTARLVDKTNNGGPISGLSSALTFAATRNAAHVMIISCDTPFLPVDLISRLYASIGQANAAIATCNERIHAACSLWRVDTAHSLPAYLALGRRSLIGFAEAIGYTTAEWSEEYFDPFFNINNDADLVNAEMILAQMPTGT